MKKILKILGVLVLLLFVMGVTGCEKENKLLKMNLYDKDGNLIPQPSSLFAIVDSTPGVSYVDLTLSYDNVGNVPLVTEVLFVDNYCALHNLICVEGAGKFEQALKNAFGPVSITINPGQTITKTTEKINIEEFNPGKYSVMAYLTGTYRDVRGEIHPIQASSGLEFEIEKDIPVCCKIAVGNLMAISPGPIEPIKIEPGPTAPIYEQILKSECLKRGEIVSNEECERAHILVEPEKIITGLKVKITR